MSVLFNILKVVLIVVLVPFLGGLLTGVDRILSARMQRRKGPPLLQPFYDVLKLLNKVPATVNQITRYYVTLSLFFTFFTVVLFFMGMDLLLCIFAFTLACIFFVIAGYSSWSPYSFVGTERELIQIMCYEPMVLIVVFGFYRVVGTFAVKDVFLQRTPLVVKLPLIFLGLTYILTIKLRKSPFDLSMSHHGHQEIVKGITTELTGICLAMVEVTHWLETVFALGLVYIFFVTRSPVSWLLAAVATLAIWFLEIVIDNSFARVKWKLALQISWLVTLACGTANLLIINFS